MKVNAYAFLDPFNYDGGGEKITRALIEWGLNAGIDIRIASVRPGKRTQHRHPDLNILIDIFNIGHSYKSLGAWRGFSKTMLSEIINSKVIPYVHVTHSYVDMCNLPYFPCSGEDQDACKAKLRLNPIRKLLIQDFSNQCFASQTMVKSLFENAKINFVLSPLHKRIIQKYFPSLENFKIIPPLIDTTLFYKYKELQDRNYDYLFMGVISEAKGFYEMREKYFDKNILLVGRKQSSLNIDFGKHLEEVSYFDVPGIMNDARNFVFLPRWPEAQGRVVAEAALCGCNIIDNNNVGATSFDFDLSMSENYTNIEEKFWSTIEAVI